jgi:hypothetical protein
MYKLIYCIYALHTGRYWVHLHLDIDYTVVLLLDIDYTA